ncbi:esterase/lipase superfamily enzyme [Rhizobium leguminosarum]
MKYGESIRHSPDNNSDVFVKGHGVALRDGPEREVGILDRYDASREVILLGSKGEWSQIRDKPNS